jgi:hypothetical protein
MIESRTYGIFLFTICAAVLVTLPACRTQVAITATSGVVAVADSALSTQVEPTFSPDYYIDQGVKYFLTMESTVPNSVRPNYSDLVIRWEWAPWLWLTGYKRRNLINTDILLKLYPTAYDTIDCRYFSVQPFCRCHVIFNYSGTRIPIYEEFTFNRQGEITFIEAWSDYPSLIPMDTLDYWAEADTVNRLSWRVPGLGNATGRIERRADWMIRAASKDTILADMLHRLKHPVSTYARSYFKQQNDMKQAHHPPPGDRFPYH